MIALGFLSATWTASFLCKRRGIDADSYLNCALASFIGGILGARLYFVALSWPNFAAHPEEIFATWLGGLSIHGGMIGALLTAWIYSRFSKLPLLEACDITGCVVPLAQAIGRWGNFFNSEAFGRPIIADFPLRLYIPPENRPPQFRTDSYFQPTFLYEAVWDVAIFLLLYFFLSDRLAKYPGVTFLTYLLLYSIGRALIEPIRVDSIMVGGYAAPSVVSVGLVIASAIGIAASMAYYKCREKKQNSA